MNATQITLISAILVTAIASGVYFFWPGSGAGKASPNNSKTRVSSDVLPPTAPTDTVDFAITKAFNEARRGILKNKESHFAWGKLGMICIAHELLPEAVVVLKQAIALRPEYPNWHYCLALALHETDIESALKHLEKSAALNDDTPPSPRLMLAEKLIELDRLDLAEKHIKTTLGKDPNNARAYLAQGRLLYERGEDRAAIASLEKSLLYSPRRKRALLVMAKAYLRLGNEPMAEKIKKSSASLRVRGWPDPYRADINTHRTGLKKLLSNADIALGYGRNSQAVALAKEATRDYPDSEHAWIMLGRGHLRLRNLDKASHAFDNALTINPRSADAMFRRGVVHIYKKEYKKGELLYKKALEIKPDFTMAFFNLGQCLAQQNDFPGAVEALQNAIRFDPNVFMIRLRLGDYLLSAKRPEDALKEFEEALALKPNSSEAQSMIAKVKAQLKKTSP